MERVQHFLPQVTASHEGEPSRLSTFGRRRPRPRHTRRPPSGLIPAIPVPVGPTECDPAASARRLAALPYRMSQRARLAVTLVMATTVAIVAVSALSGGDVTATTTVTVGTGDSLWEIAERTVPGGNTGDVVAQISDLNGLTSSVILPGQVLLVPAS